MQHHTHQASRSSVTLMLPAVLAAASVFIAGTVADGSALPPGESYVPSRGESRLIEELLEEVLMEEKPRIMRGGDELIFPTVKFFIEFNETDEDVGVQSLIGGEPYEVLKGFGPDEKKIFELKPKRSLKTQGMSDFFFESGEPSLDEVSLAEFLDRFPAGEYEFESVTIEGEDQEGETMFTHVIPAGPVITFPTKGAVVDLEKVMVAWEPVTMTTALNPPQVPVEIVGYQVIVTREDPLRVYSVDVSAGTTSVGVPLGFLDPGTEYEVEVLAIEESDNQTISLLFFETK